MDPLRDPEEFGRRVRSVRGYLGLGRSEFAKLLGYTGDSTIDRIERGELGKRRSSPEARLALAEEIIRKTGCPPALFGLSAPGEATAAEILRRLAGFEEALKAVKLELRGEFARETGALTARLQTLERGDSDEKATGG